MEWYLIVLLLLAGFAAGFINTLAGNGSLITLPLLIFIGLPANVANGTNRISILFQSVAGLVGFKQQKTIEPKTTAILSIPVILGAICGALLAVVINAEMMKFSIGILLVVMFFLIILKPDSWLKEQSIERNEKRGFFQYIMFFILGVYGGFLQAGVGLFLLAGLVLGSGFDLIKANAVKVFMVMLFTPFALAVFIYNNQVDYYSGSLLAVGSMAGAYLAARFSTKISKKFIRNLLLIVICVASLKIFGVFDFVLNYFTKA